MFNLLFARKVTTPLAEIRTVAEGAITTPEGVVLPKSTLENVEDPEMVCNTVPLKAAFPAPETEEPGAPTTSPLILSIPPGPTAIVLLAFKFTDNTDTGLEMAGCGLTKGIITGVVAVGA